MSYLRTFLRLNNFGLLSPSKKPQTKYICCTPSVDVFHPWIFTPSMDERAHSSCHLTRLVEGICIRFHRIGINSMDELIDPSIISPHWWRSTTMRYLRNQPCIITLASHSRRNLGYGWESSSIYLHVHIIIMPLDAENHRWSSSTVPLMKVGTLPVTRACSVPETSPLVTGYRGGVQLVKTGGWRVFVVKSEHIYLQNRGNS